MQRPREMTFSMIREAVTNNWLNEHNRPYLTEDFALVHGMNADFFHAVLKTEVPYRINDYRLGRIVRGEVRSNINLIEHHATAGHLILLTPGSIGQIHAVSPDLLIQGMLVRPETLQVAMAGRLPAAIATARMREFVVKPDAASLDLVGQLYTLLWQAVHTPQCPPEAIHALVAAQVHTYASLITTMLQTSATVRSHQQRLFDRFIALVNEHCRREHQIAFYASELCITEKHLSTVVSQTSGVTAKEWIDRALVAEAKVLLKHSDRQMSQIADDLHFPNPSFFTKYFRRLTGMTPVEYRKL